MIDYLGLVKCAELRAQIDRARWERDEDAYYDELSHAPDIEGIMRKLLGLLGLRKGVHAFGAGGQGSDASPPAAQNRCQAAARP
jgi:hypothetical protein